MTAVSGACQDCANWLEVVEAGAGKGVLHGTAIISVMEVIQTMILLPSEYVRYRFVEPLKQRLKDEGKEEGKSLGLMEGIAVGEAQGRAEMRAEILEWLSEKEEADREGRPFDKPMPGAERNGGSPNNNGSEPKR